MIIEASRRTSRRAVQRIKDSLVEYDRVLFSSVKELAVSPDQNFEIIRDSGTYVLKVTDPTVSDG